MKVRAKARGFYNNVERNPGDVFDIKDEVREVKDAVSGKQIKDEDGNVIKKSDFSSAWMVKIDDKPFVKEPRRDLPRVEPVPVIPHAPVAAEPHVLHTDPKVVK